MYFYGSKNQERVFKISLTPLPRDAAVQVFPIHITENAELFAKPQFTFNREKHFRLLELI
jgi:hypothetical protein